ncbi:hypothetical protein [Herbidospora daliensis]|uniref:hypothetical protein n=1 Tax=Herbidospora daliensis TaxID=295585 RepID=UPI0007832F62|nr:hypothetical protein [Herbidospora daliensis]
MSGSFKVDDYLRLADQMAGRSAGRKRPMSAHLRRATSTAYYALFHELVGQGTRRAVRGGSDDQRRTVSRWYAHGNFRQTARWVSAIAAKTSAPDAVTLLLSSNGHVDADLALLARTFTTLQRERHTADYDPDYKPTRFDTLGHVTSARLAVDAARRLDGANVQAFDMFLLLSLGGERMVRNT